MTDQARVATTPVAAHPSVADLAAHVEDRPRRGLLVAVSIAFALLLASSNAINPLLPLKAHALDLDARTGAASFATYLVALAITLTGCARASVQRRARVLLPLAVLTIVAADQLMSANSLTALFVGRAVTGLAVGLGTGSAATLAVEAAGESGRSLAATGNLVGAFVGTAGATAAVRWAPRPIPAVFDVHAVVAGLALVLLLSFYRGAGVRRAAVPAAASTQAADAALPPALRVGDHARRGSTLVGYGVGTAVWIVTVNVLALLPLALVGKVPGGTALVASLLIVGFFTTSAITQFLVLAAPKVFGLWPCLVATTVGAVLITLGLWRASLLTVVVGVLVVGLASGAGYRGGLHRATAGLPSIEHGAVTSRYVSVAYIVSAASLLATGLVARAGGPVGSWLLVVGLLAVTALALGVVERRTR